MPGHPWTYQESSSYADMLKERFLQLKDTKGCAELEYEKVESPRRIVFRMGQTSGGEVHVKWECWNGDENEFADESVESTLGAAREWVALKFNEPLRKYYDHLTD